MAVTGNTYTVGQHFIDRAPEVLATYRAILAAAKKFGLVREEAKKTSIHLARRMAFAGVATRRTALILTLKAATDIRSDRITKHERVSANRWHLDMRLEKPAEVDRELIGWLKQSYHLAG